MTEDSKTEFIMKRMAYIPDAMLYASQRDYRDPNLFNTYIEYVIDYNKYYFKNIGDFGLILSILLYPILAVTDFFENWVPYYTKEIDKPLCSKYDKLDRNTQIDGQFTEIVINKDYIAEEKESVIAKSIRNREEQGTLTDSYSLNKNEKATKAGAINFLRSYLYKNNLILKANRVRGKLTFGKELDKILSIINPEIKSLSSNEIEEKLQQLFQEDVEVIVVDYKIGNSNLKKELTSDSNLSNLIAFIIMVVFIIIKCVF